MTFLEGYTTQRFYSADIFRGIADFWRFFCLRPFWVIGLWKTCGQIRPLPWGLGLRGVLLCGKTNLLYSRDYERHMWVMLLQMNFILSASSIDRVIRVILASMTIQCVNSRHRGGFNLNKKKTHILQIICKEDLLIYSKTCSSKIFLKQYRFQKIEITHHLISYSTLGFHITRNIPPPSPKNTATITAIMRHLKPSANICFVFLKNIRNSF